MVAGIDTLPTGSPKIGVTLGESTCINLVCLWICPVWEGFAGLSTVLSDELRGKNGKHADSHYGLVGMNRHVP